MKVFLYEHITATSNTNDPLYREGAVIRDAVREDFARIDGVELIEGTFDDAVRFADATLLIAPETDGVLEKLARNILKLGGKLLGSQPEAIRLAADKFALAQRWLEVGIPTPPTVLAYPGYSQFPAVVKPRDGAGSERMALVLNAEEYERCRSGSPSGMIAQPFIPGIPASIAFLVGTQRILPLCPTRQILGGEGGFHYLGGELPLSPALAERAIRLGRAALEAAGEGFLGYVGIDLILSDAGDFAVEINPRFTTSYVGLRAATNTNLIEAMLRINVGNSIRAIPWYDGKVAWDSVFRAIRSP